MEGNAFDMDEAYGAMRPHQRGLFNVLGMAAVGGKKLIDAGANAFDTVGRIIGYGAPVTMDEVQRGASDAAMFAMPGTMGRKIAPRDEYMATKFGNSERSAAAGLYMLPENLQTAVAGNFKAKPAAPYVNDPHPGVTADLEYLAQLLERGKPLPTNPQMSAIKSFNGGNLPVSPEAYAALERQRRRQSPMEVREAEINRQFDTLNKAERDLVSQAYESPRHHEIGKLFDRERARLADMYDRVDDTYLKPVK